LRLTVPPHGGIAGVARAGVRLLMSFTSLGCQNLGLTDPVTVTLDGNGVAIAVTTAPLSSKPRSRRRPPAPARAPTSYSRRGRGTATVMAPITKFQNPSGM
jgi:hypothetical protein